MKNRFSIGQISNLYNIPIKTLRYYDEIGLFKPIQVDNSSGYRYYSTDQFEQLHTIIYLKAMGIPLKTIKAHLDKRQIDSFLEVLKEQYVTTRRKIDEFIKIEKALENRIAEIEGAKKNDILDRVIIKELNERKILRLTEKINSISELELSLRKLENSLHIPVHVMIGKVGLFATKDNVLKGIFLEYHAIFILLEESIGDYPYAEKIKKGTFACISFRGNRSEAPKYYKVLLEYIKENKMEIIGDSIEREIINQFISEERCYHLTEIQIPVKYID